MGGVGLGGEAAGETEEEEEEVGGGSKGGGGEGGGEERKRERRACRRKEKNHAYIWAHQNVEGDAVTRDGAAEVVDGLAVLCMLHAEASRLGASA